jgi:hypothetical protein
VKSADPNNDRLQSFGHKKRQTGKCMTVKCKPPFFRNTFFCLAPEPTIKA